MRLRAPTATCNAALRALLSRAALLYHACAPQKKKKKKIISNLALVGRDCMLRATSQYLLKHSAYFTYTCHSPLLPNIYVAPTACLHAACGRCGVTVMTLRHLTHCNASPLPSTQLVWWDACILRA